MAEPSTGDFTANFHRRCIAQVRSNTQAGGQISGSGRGGAVLCRVWPAGRGLSIWLRGPDLVGGSSPWARS